MIAEKKSSKELLMFIQEKVSQSTSDLKKIFSCIQLFLGKEVPPASSITFEEVLKHLYKIFFTIEGYDESLFFENIILSGIKVMKTHLCQVKTKPKHQSFCPVCSKWIFLIGENVRPTLRQNTSLFCSASHQKISDQNLPLTFPNSMIYGENYVKQNVEKN